MATKKMAPKKKAFRRFADGGETTDYVDGRSEDNTDKSNRRENERNANATDDPIAAMNQMEGWTGVREGKNANIDDSTRQRAMDSVKAMPRRPVSKTPVAPKATGGGRGGQGGASAKQLADQAASDNRRALNASEPYKRTDYSRPEDEGLENLSADFIGGPVKAGATALAGLAAGMGLKRLLKGGAKAGAEQMIKRGSPEIGYEATKRIGMSEGRKALPAPPRALPGPKGAAAEVEDVVAKPSRDAIFNRKAWERGPSGELGRGGMKKGGAVKAFAKGGAVTASRRADGIASKGKTRGKIY